MTKTLQTDVTISGTVGYSGNVGVDIQKIVNLGLTGSVSGTVSLTMSRGTIYSGGSWDTGGDWNAIYYYIGTINNTMAAYVSEYKVYDLYDQDWNHWGQEVLHAGNITINNVKVPFTVEWSEAVKITW